MTALAFSHKNSLLYGLLGLPLAFVALPLYVILPNHYAREFGVSLATLGAVLLGARLFDAFIDPLLGRWTDHLFARSSRAVLMVCAVAALLLAIGFSLLFFPPTRDPLLLVAWATAALVFTYAAYSLLSVAHQSWGAMLGGDEAQRSRIVSWREALGLVGVLMASVLPVAVGLPATTAVFCVVLLIGWLAWRQSVPPVAKSTVTSPATDIWLPWRRPEFRRLLAVFVFNGIASAIPATLVLFFVQDRLQTPQSMEPAFLGSYFLFAALSIPLWLWVVKAIGLARTWLLGMVLSILVFIWATQLGTGDVWPFIVVCALSGIALGTDLALPGAMLAGLIDKAGDRGQSEGAYFGWWNFAIKLNLALAAGLALPLLGVFGYSPGARNESALLALTIAYCVLPCILKAVAGGLLYATVIRPTHSHPLIKATP